MGKSISDFSSVTTVGLDLAKHVFQIHGIDASGRVVVAKAMRRNKLLEFFASLPPCLVGLEASGSAHHWARELIKLGHDARMMPPAYVKPYVRRQKNDASDAAAICEAVSRPSMRFVGVRSLENRAALMRHKTREMPGLATHTTAQWAAWPFDRGRRDRGAGAQTRPRTGRADRGLRRHNPRRSLRGAGARSRCNCGPSTKRLRSLTAPSQSLCRRMETARRLMSIPGFGPITASAMAATVQDASSFAGPREFAAFLGLTPKQNSSGGKQKLMGAFRRWATGTCGKMLVVGAHAVLFHRMSHTPTRCGCGRRSFSRRSPSSLSP